MQQIHRAAESEHSAEAEHLLRPSLSCESVGEKSFALIRGAPRQLPPSVVQALEENRLEVMGNQVSGHAVLYKLPENILLKRTNPNEIQVYEEVQKHKSLIHFTAPYFGHTENLHLSVVSTTRTTLSEDRRKEQYIFLGDLTAGFRTPNIMDVKLGTMTFEKSASVEKQQSQLKRARETTSGKHGARVDGLNVYQPKIHQKIRLRHAENWQKPLSESFSLFLSTGVVGEVRWDVAALFIEQLANLYATLTKHRYSINFLQSSLLFLYEADLEAPVKVRLGLIDFDHARILHFEPGSASHKSHSDCGCAFGVANLVVVLQSLLAPFAQQLEKHVEQQQQQQPQQEEDASSSSISTAIHDQPVTAPVE